MFFVETGTYTINDVVAVPLGVVAHSVPLSGISAISNGGEQTDISGSGVLDYIDIMRRDGNTLIRAKPNLVGAVAAEESEELDFSTVYYLQE